MGFKEITERAPAEAARKMATFALKKRGKRAAKPSLYIAINKALLATCDQSEASRGKAPWTDCGVVLLIGEDDDAGKIRLRKVAKGTGLASSRDMKAVVIFDLGYVAHFGDRPTEKFEVDAKFVYGSGAEEIEMHVSAETIEEHAFEDDEPQRERIQAPSAAPPEVQKSASAPRHVPPAAQSDAKAIEKLGVRVEFGPRPKIFHGGEELELTPRQAKFLGALVPGIGSVMLTADIMQKTGIAAVHLSDDFLSLGKVLPDLGLRIRFTPKMGYTLSVDG